MSIDEILAELESLPGVTFYPGAAEDDIDEMEQRYGFRLPALHRDLLLKTNGIEADGGYLRLYGVGPQASVDMGRWNESDLWKFSWHPFINDFFCFGGDGWGMQVSYRLAETNPDRSDSPTYILADSDHLAHTSRGTFEQYLEKGFLGNARHQLSDFSRRVRKKVGDLSPGELVTLAPHPMIGGPERVANVVKMPAVTAMVLNGDINTELIRVTANYTIDGVVRGVIPYVDDKGRGRMRLDFEPSDTDPQPAPLGTVRGPVNGIPKLDVLILPAAGPVRERVTKFGGQPVWLTEPAWPLAPATGEPMDFVAQIRLEPEIFGNDHEAMAYLFVADAVWSEDTFDPYSGESAVVLQPGDPPHVATEPRAEGPSLRHVLGDNGVEEVPPERCEFVAVTMPGTDSDEPSEQPELATPADAVRVFSEMSQSGLMTGSGGIKVGGDPYFFRGWPPPFTPDNWRLLLQLDGELPFFLNLSPDGVGYVLVRTDLRAGVFFWERPG